MTFNALTEESLIEGAESFKCYYNKTEVAIGLLLKYLDIPIDTVKRVRASQSSKERDQHSYHRTALDGLCSKGNPFHEAIDQGAIQMFLHDARRFRNQWTHRKENEATDADIYQSMPSQQEFTLKREELESALDVVLACVKKEAGRRARSVAHWESLRFQEASLDIREERLVKRERLLEVREHALDGKLEQQQIRKQEYEYKLAKLDSNIRTLEEVYTDLADAPSKMFCEDSSPRRKLDFLQIARCWHRSVVANLSSENKVLESRIAALKVDLDKRTVESENQFKTYTYGHLALSLAIDLFRGIDSHSVVQTYTDSRGKIFRNGSPTWGKLVENVDRLREDLVTATRSEEVAWEKQQKADFGRDEAPLMGDKLILQIVTLRLQLRNMREEEVNASLRGLRRVYIQRLQTRLATIT